MTCAEKRDEIKRTVWATVFAREVSRRKGTIASATLKANHAVRDFLIHYNESDATQMIYMGINQT